MQETLDRFLGQEDHWRRDRLPSPVFLGFPCGSDGKDSACSSGDLGFITGLRRSPVEGKDTHSSILAWRIPWTVKGHRVTESQTWLNDFHFHFSGGLVVKNLPANGENTNSIPGSGRSPEKEMATHCCLENPMDREVWWATVHGVAKESYTT